VTNITRNEISDAESGIRLLVGKKRVDLFKNFYGEESRAPNKAFAIWGSAGFLEIAVENKSAAALLNVKRGNKVVVDPATS
jgi:S-adenosylmethionine hydrolase